VALELVELDTRYERAYEGLLNVCPSAMIYHSLSFRRFLKEFLPSSVSDHYLLAFDGEELLGALPTFVTNGPLGPVLNSLPFFGSHGGVLLKPNAKPVVFRFLTDALVTFCQSQKVRFATIIDTPFTSNEIELQNTFNFQYSDQRIGQLTSLPSGTDSEKVSEMLFGLYHKKTRNIVRKALRNDLELAFDYDQSSQTLKELHALHESNIMGLGGIPKPKEFFDVISNQLLEDNDYRIYTARSKSGELVCGLMLLYFKDMVEYFVPATTESVLSAQPLSALIFLSMRDAILERQAKIWNWGGTWLSQDGVYHFKSRWGTTDRTYKYYTRVFSDPAVLQDVDRKTLQNGYPWFYTVPFSTLNLDSSE